MRASRLCWAALVCCVGIGANPAQPPLRQLKFDPAAESVELFEGIAGKRLAVRVVALNAHQANVFITNQTKKPLTIELPKAAIIEHDLAQFGIGQPGGFLPNGGNMIGAGSGTANSGLASGGRAQSTGGPFQPANGVNPGNGPNGFPNGPGGNAIGNGFFSIPPERVVQIELRTVCLHYGRPDPSPSMPYTLRKLDDVVTSAPLKELLESYTPRTDKSAMQAAAWHLANHLEWEQLRQLPSHNLPISGEPLFLKKQLDAAKQLVESAEKQAANRASTTSVPVIQSASVK